MLGLLLAVPALAFAQADDAGAADVAALLAQRCAVCHSAGSDEPKAVKDWPHAKNLAATAADPDIVVPGKPLDSELFLAVDFEDMPPSDSDVEPLNDAEKALIEAWIAAGAPVPDALAVEGKESGAPTLGDPPATLVGWVARFHPLLVHFPLALLSAAFLAELLFRLRPAWRTDVAAGFCLALGALSAPPSASLGWLLAEFRTGSGDDLFWHRWAGVATAVLALAAWWAVGRWPKRRLGILFLLAVIVAVTGHTGGVLTYGDDWLTPPFL